MGNIQWQQVFGGDELTFSSDDNAIAYYGQDFGYAVKETNDFGQYCLKARKLSEAGVRYVQINYTDNTNNPAWDQHSNMPKHMEHARATDKPVAGLITDLKQRGLLEDTIVWWGSEFGRTPYAQDKGTGRDHNSDGFTVWLPERKSIHDWQLPLS